MSQQTPKTVMICPDSFKGTLTATAAAEALAAGWRSARPHDTILTAPMADGGEGTHAAFRAANTDATIVELAELCGIETLTNLNPHHAGTRPFGEAIARAATNTTSGHTLYLGIGGSASTDCGAGMLQGLGVRILDRNGHPIGPGLAGIATATTIDFGPAEPTLKHLDRLQLSVITDVTAPLTGPDGAAHAFGPQKGLEPHELAAADEYLARFGALLRRTAPHSAPDTTPGAGAAGGVGYALLTLGARLLPGAHHMAHALAIDDKIHHCDLVITGEGALDATSLQGKVPATILHLATQAQRPCHIVAGTIRDSSLGARFASAQALDQIAGSGQKALDDPARYLHQAAVTIAASI